MAKIEPSAKDKPRKFQHIYKDDDGGESIWKYDLDKFPNGPISVEQKYPVGYEKNLKKQQKEAKVEKNKSTLQLAKEGKIKPVNKDSKFW
jgi:hypothetical protein